MWHIQHPEGPREINELHVPVNEPVKVTMTSQDVIHDFYIPAFRVKKRCCRAGTLQSGFRLRRQELFIYSARNIAVPITLR